MEVVKKSCVLPALAFILILVAGAFLFSYLFYQRDLKALADFKAAYEAYDRAISEYSSVVFAADPEGAAAPGEPERTAGEALLALAAKASARISSINSISTSCGVFPKHNKDALKNLW